MDAPVWNIPLWAFQTLIWGAIILMAISVVVILAILIREMRRGEVW